MTLEQIRTELQFIANELEEATRFEIELFQTCVINNVRKLDEIITSIGDDL